MQRSEMLDNEQEELDIWWTVRAYLFHSPERAIFLNKKY